MRASQMIVAALAVMTLTTIIGVDADQGYNVSYTYDPTPTASNPFRGMAAYLDNVGTDPLFPTSLEYTYVALKDLLPAQGNITFDIIDQALQRATGRNNHLILRLYVDYPSMPSGVPAYLNQGPGAVTYTTYSDYGGGQSPDYTNQRLIDAMVFAIEQLGARYDYDSRLAYIQLGLLGFWGEWHTYPQTQLMAPRSVQSRILLAYDQAFNMTKLLVSQDEMQYWEPTDTAYPPTSVYDIGYHDDAFCDSTYSATAPQSYFFYDRLVAHGITAGDVYRPKVFGGEILPSLQSTIFASSGYTGQPFLPAVQKTGASFLLDNFAFETDPLGARRTATIQNSLSLGYQFTLEQLSFTVPSYPCYNYYSEPGYCVDVSARVTNKGNAPFPYDLMLQYTDATGGWSARTFYTYSQVNSLGGNSTMEVSAQLQWPATPDRWKGNFTVQLSSYRALYGNRIKFANAEVQSDGLVYFTVDPANAQYMPAYNPGYGSSSSGGWWPSDSTGGWWPSDSTGGWWPSDSTGGWWPSDSTGGWWPSDSTGGWWPSDSTGGWWPSDSTGGWWPSDSTGGWWPWSSSGGSETSSSSTGGPSYGSSSTGPAKSSSSSTGSAKSSSSSTGSSKSSTGSSSSTGAKSSTGSNSSTGSKSSTGSSSSTGSKSSTGGSSTGSKSSTGGSNSSTGSSSKSSTGSNPQSSTGSNPASSTASSNPNSSTGSNPASSTGSASVPQSSTGSAAAPVSSTGGGTITTDSSTAAPTPSGDSSTGNVVPPAADSSTGSTPPTGDSSTGSTPSDGSTGSVPDDGSSVVVTFKLDFSIDSLPGGLEAFKANLAAETAKALKIDVNRVLVIGVAAGSVVAQIQFSLDPFNAPGAATPAQLAADFIQQVNDPQSALHAEPIAGKAIEGSASVTTDDGSPSKGVPIGAIIGGIAGGVVILIGIVVYCCYRSNSKVESDQRRMAASIQGGTELAASGESFPGQKLDRRPTQETEFTDLNLATMSDARVAELANV